MYVYLQKEWDGKVKHVLRQQALTPRQAAKGEQGGNWILGNISCLLDTELIQLLTMSGPWNIISPAAESST